MNLQKLLRSMKKICFLPPLPTLLIAVPSFVLVIWILVNEPVHPVIANLAYVLSAYALVITITGVAGIVKWVRAGITILVVSKNSGFTYPGMLIYLMALYTFYAVISAVMNVIKFRKYGSPVMSAAKVIIQTTIQIRKCKQGGKCE